MDAINSWASDARANDFRQVVDHQHAITTIASLLRKECDAEGAAASVADAYLARTRTLDGKLNMAPFWAIICDTTRKLGGDELHARRLADLVIAISQLPDVEDGQKNDGPPAKNARGDVYWRGLPDWALTFREYGAYLDGPEDNDVHLFEWKQQAPFYHNANTFAATLLARAPAGETFGMDSYAVNALGGALELDARDPDPETNAQVLMDVPAAAVWMGVAGRQLYALARHSRDARTDKSGVRHDFLVGVSIERWHLWCRRLADMAQDVDFDEACREHAARALGWMREAKQSDKTQETYSVTSR